MKIINDNVNVNDMQQAIVTVALEVPDSFPLNRISGRVATLLRKFMPWRVVEHRVEQMTERLSEADPSLAAIQRAVIHSKELIA